MPLWGNLFFMVGLRMTVPHTGSIASFAAGYYCVEALGLKDADLAKHVLVRSTTYRAVQATRKRFGCGRKPLWEQGSLLRSASCARQAGFRAACLWRTIHIRQHIRSAQALQEERDIVLVDIAIAIHVCRPALR